MANARSAVDKRYGNLNVKSGDVQASRFDNFAADAVHLVQRFSVLLMTGL